MLHEVAKKLVELNYILLRCGLRPITGISFENHTWAVLAADADAMRFIEVNDHKRTKSFMDIPVQISEQQPST